MLKVLRRVGIRAAQGRTQRQQCPVVGAVEQQGGAAATTAGETTHACSFNTDRVKTTPSAAPAVSTAAAEWDWRDVSLEDALPTEQIPGPPRIPVLGTWHTTWVGKEYDSRFIVESNLKLFKKYGPVVRQRYGPVDIIQLFDVRDAEKLRRSEGRYPRLPPMELFEQVSKDLGQSPNIIASNGPSWERQRSAVQKYVLKPQVVARFTEIQDQVAMEFADYLRRTRDDNDMVYDMRSILAKYTVEAIGYVCYAKKLGTLMPGTGETSDGNIIGQNAKALSDRLFPLLAAWPFVKMGIYRGEYKKFLNSAKVIQGVTEQLIKERESLGGEVDCVLDKLMQEHKQNNTITRSEVVALVDQLLWGGVDSTAIMLSHVVYQLAKHPEVQEKLYEELNRELPSGEAVTYQMLHTKLKYLRATIREVYRISPASATSYNRRLDHDEVFGGYRVPANYTLMVQTGVMGKLPQYFDNPDEFLPERWLNDQNRELHKLAAHIIQPFGYGRRGCLGRRFAEQEIYLAIIQLVRNFRIIYKGRELGLINKTFSELDGPLDVILQDR